MNYYVYELIDPRNNLVFYVGKGKTRDKLNRVYRRIKDHLNSNDKSNRFKYFLIQKIRKLGLEVEFRIIKEGISESEAFILEIELIKKYGKRIDNSGNLVNITDGGEGISGFKHSNESKELMSIKHKELIKLNGGNFKGRKHNRETKQRMSIIQKKICKTRINSMQGKHHSEETKRKISEKQKGKTRLPKEMWYKFSNPGSKNPQAKKYIFINPNNEKFEVIGFFKDFIKQNELSYDACLEYRNKGKIPPPKNPNHNRMSKTRINSIGWEVIDA